MVDLQSLATKWSTYSHPRFNLDNYGFGCVDDVLKYLFVSKTEMNKINLTKDIARVGYISTATAIKNELQNNIAYLIVYEDTNNTVIEEFKKMYKEDLCNAGWEFLDTSAMPMAHYIQQKNPADAIVMRNIEKQQTVIVTPHGYYADHWTRTLAVIDKLLPWFFDLSDEKDFLKLLDKIATEHKQKDVTKLAGIMNEAFANLNMREQIIKDKFNGFENILKESLIDKVNRNIENTRAKIERTNFELSDLYSQLSELNFNLQGYQAIDDSSNNFVNFFLQHKNIDEIKQLDEHSFAFTIRETIEYYDEEGFKTSYNTAGSYFYKKFECAKLLYELFINHRGKLETVSEFECRGLTKLFPTKQSYSKFSSNIYHNAIPHPHLAYFGCLGGNEGQIGKYLEKGDWDMAIEQAIGATKNINISDSTPMHEMIRYILNHKNESFIIADNGERMTVTQFEKYIGGDKKDVEED